MRILQVLSYGYLAGGAEKSVYLLSQELRRSGHQVKIISSDHKPEAEHFSDIEFPEIDSPKNSIFKKFISHLWYVHSYRVVKGTVKEFKPDIVHFHTTGQLSPSALFAVGTTPAALTSHGPSEYLSEVIEWALPPKLFKQEISKKNLTIVGRLYYLYYTRIQKPVYRYGLKRLKVLICPSKYMAQVLQKENFGPPINQIYNGILLPAHKKLINKNQLLYVGRLEQVKGVHVLLAAIPEIIKHNPSLKLSIVGEGSEKIRLQEFVKKQDLSNYVKFNGWQDGSVLRKSYENATAVIIPSIWPEVQGLVGIEALATGRPVICSNTGGLPELVMDKVTGEIVNSGDPVEIVKAVKSLFQRSDLDEVSLRCSDSVKGLNLSQFTKNIETLYTKILKSEFS